jgi:hypothetical protein
MLHICCCFRNFVLYGDVVIIWVCVVGATDCPCVVLGWKWDIYCFWFSVASCCLVFGCLCFHTFCGGPVSRVRICCPVLELCLPLWLDLYWAGETAQSSFGTFLIKEYKRHPETRECTVVRDLLHNLRLCKDNFFCRTQILRDLRASVTPLHSFFHF